MKGISEKYKIKVKRKMLDKEKINKYSKLNNEKIPIKKQILYNLKFNPEIIINQFHQTADNINTDTNIKRHQPKKSIVITRNNNIFDIENDLNNFSFSEFYHSCDDFHIKKEEENNDDIYNQTISNIKSNKNDFININNENSTLIRKYNSLTTRNNYDSCNTFSRTRNPCIKNVKFNRLYKPKIKISDYIIPSHIEEIKISKYERPKTDRKINKFNINIIDFMDIKNNIYSNKRKNLRHKRKNLSQEEINPKEYLYNNYRNSCNLTDYNNAAISEGFNFIKNQKKVKINNTFLYTNNDENVDSYNKICNNTDRNYSCSNRNWYDKEALNNKLMNYRIKLFKQFYIHFEQYYKSFLNEYKKLFFMKIKYYTFENNNLLDISFSKKSRNNKGSENFNSTKITNNKNDLLEIYKFSTTNDYYNLKANNINNNLDLRSSLFNNEHKNSNANFSSFSQIEFEKNKFSISSKKSMDFCFSDRNNLENKNLFDSVITSPSLKRNRDIYIKTEINFPKEENELFRNLEELNKKEEQIIRRKQSKNQKDISLLNLIKNKYSKNGNNKIKESKEYNQFTEIRNNSLKKRKNYIKKVKINNAINKNVILDKDYKYKKTFFNYHLQKSTNTKKNNILNNNKNKKTTFMNSTNYIKINNSNIKTDNKINSSYLFNKSKINNNKKFVNIKKSNNIKTNKINNPVKKLIKVYSNDIIPSSEDETITKDKRIHINMSYYNYSKSDKSSKIKYNLLNEAKTISMNLINNFNLKNKSKNKDIDIRMKERLSSIKEEEISNQNSKIFDELISTFNLNYIGNINIQSKNILQFINIIETILIQAYKRILFYKMKTIYIVNKMDKILVNNANKKIIIHKKNKSSNQIYNKKFGIKKIKQEKNKIEQDKIPKELWGKRVIELKKYLLLFVLRNNS